MSQNLFAGRVEPIQLEDEMQRSYLDYAMSVIVSRALPDVRDGLKPVQRRILWSMVESGLRPDRPHRKSVAAVGEVLKKYHPHGDQSVYDALVRMAQDWVMRAPLIDGHGNFGSVDGDRPPPTGTRRRAWRRWRWSCCATSTARRSISCRTSTGTSSNRWCCRAATPTCWSTVAAGIAVGMATNIPPHNLGEIIDATTHYLDHPEATTADLMKFVKAPDFPTGATIMGRQGIRDAYETGRGSIKVRAVATVEEGTQNRSNIVVTELPYQVNKARLAEKIADLVRTGKIKDIADVRDESNRQGMRLVIVCKRGSNPQVVLNQLYKQTQLQENFSVIMLSLVEGQPRTLTLAEMIGYYVDHQVDVITRRTEYLKRKAEERDHIVQGLLIALDHLDEVIKIIRASQDADAARTKLMKTFKLSEIQANHILDMPLRRLTRLARTELEAEHEELLKTITYLDSLLKSPKKKLRGVIAEELAEIRKKHANPRRTQLKADVGDLDVEDLIAEEDVVITVSRRGLREAPADRRLQAPGPRRVRGVKGATLKEEDVIANVFITTTHHWLLFFTSKGKVYRVKAHEVPREHAPGAGSLRGEPAGRACQRRRARLGGAGPQGVRGGQVPAVLHPSGHGQEDGASGIRLTAHGSGRDQPQGR